MPNANSSKGSKSNPRKTSTNSSKKGLQKKLVISSTIPAANVTRVITRQPIYRPRSDGSVDVKHKELFYAIPGNTGWATSNALKYWEINPANGILFPWLSRIATAYEKYKFKKFKVHYTPNTGTSANGNISMAIDFDVSDDAPTSLVELMSFDGATQSQPFAKSVLSYPVKQLNSFVKHLFVAKQGSNSGEPRTSHMGKLFLATDTSALTPGFLSVSYEVNLMIPEGKKASDLLYDRFSSTVDPLILSSRRYVNSPSPAYSPVNIINYAPYLSIVPFTGNSDGRYSTKVLPAESVWNLATVHVTGTGLGSLANISLSNSHGLDFRYGSQIRSAADVTYWIYYKVKDSYIGSPNPSWFRLDLFDVTTTLISVLMTYQAVTTQQALDGIPALHGALTSYSTLT